MPAQQTFRTWRAAEHEEGSESALRRYLDQLGEESWESEYKSSVSDSGDLQPRIAIAALANRDGGELFLGVTPNKALVGTAFSSDSLQDALRQVGALRSEEFVTDLNECVRTGIQAVELSPGRLALVVEVVEQALPVYVRTTLDDLELFVRSGATSPRIGAFGALGWYKERRRARMLQKIYREFDLMSQQVRVDVGFATGVSPVLPYLQRSLEDGSFYTILTDSDRDALVGRAGGDFGGGNPGFLGRLLRLDAEVEQQRSMMATSDSTLRNLAMVDHALMHRASTIANLSGQLGQSRDQFRTWITRQGIRI